VQIDALSVPIAFGASPCWLGPGVVGQPQSTPLEGGRGTRPIQQVARQSSSRTLMPRMGKKRPAAAPADRYAHTQWADARPAEARDRDTRADWLSRLQDDPMSALELERTQTHMPLTCSLTHCLPMFEVTRHTEPLV
jgi:hypothetical protein